MTLVAASQQVHLSLHQRATCPTLFSELSGWSVLGITVTGTSALGMIWTTSTTTSDILLLDLRDLVVHFVQQCAINRILWSINTDLLHDLRNIRSTYCGEPAQRLPQSQLWFLDKLLEMQYNRICSVAEVVSEASELSAPASHRLDAVTEDALMCAIN